MKIDFRGLLAFLVLAPTLVVLSKLAWANDKEAVLFLTGSTAIVVGWYFYQKGRSKR